MSGMRSGANGRESLVVVNRPDGLLVREVWQVMAGRHQVALKINTESGKRRSEGRGISAL